MNGFQIIDLKEATFMDKLLKREPRENAFVEINNLLACVPILQLDRDSINKSLEKHNVSHKMAGSRLLNFYSILLKHFLTDSVLDKKEIEKLHHLRSIFKLEEREVGSVHKNTVQPVYRMYVQQAIADGDLTAEEKEKLNKLAERLSIPKQFAKKIYSNEASKYLHSVLKSSISDGMLSDGEEMELHRIAKNLQVELNFSENAKKNLERCRRLWRMHMGEIPSVNAGIKLKSGETCSAFVNAKLYKVQSQNMPVRYSGYHEAKGQKDIGFHAGVLKDDKLYEKVLSFSDVGTLYFLNNRLLFKGKFGKKGHYYKNLMGGTFYNNGLLIEKLRGNDEFFKFRGDMQAIKLIFDNLMTKSRR